MIKNNFMEKKEYGSSAEQEQKNIFLRMPLTFILLCSSLCVMLVVWIKNPIVYSDAIDFCVAGITDNVHMFEGTGKLKEAQNTFVEGYNSISDEVNKKIEENKQAREEEAARKAAEAAKPVIPEGYDGTSAGVADILSGETMEVGPDVVVGNPVEEAETIVAEEMTDVAASDETEVAETTAEEEPEEEVIDENVYMVPYVPYIEYTPKEVDSRYFTDLGRIPFSMTAEYVVADDDYFEDSCWIGDSRTVGIADYSGWPDADFYCDNGFCAYEYSVGKEVHLQGKGAKRTIDEAMDLKQYGKVYIMLGVNDTGYGTTTTFKENYSNLINMIKEKQPNAIIYIVGNMRISEEADAKAKNGALSNLNINAKNVAASELADGVRTFYIDFNEYFTDDNGFLIANKTFDGYHLYADGYMELVQFFKEHTIVPPAEDMELRYSEEALAPIVGEVENNE